MSLNAFAEKKIQLYTHQADTFDHVLEGKNVIITTLTASGKTLAYALPVFEGLIANQEATALFIYPTKALTRDQLLFLKALDADLRARTKPAIYDGDTRQELRSKIRSSLRIILTNMYELHHILAWRAKWGDFWANLSYIVVDEAHRHRGIFGSNTALLLRRLRRVCNYYDAEPQFLLSSATLGNAGTFAETLTGLPFIEVDNDGFPGRNAYFASIIHKIKAVSPLPPSWSPPKWRQGCRPYALPVHEKPPRSLPYDAGKNSPSVKSHHTAEDIIRLSGGILSQR